MPLAWLIGEATEHVAEHTGPGIGGFFNASFGNAPELIIALLAVYNGLPDVVRGSIIGSVVSNLLLVLGPDDVLRRAGRARPALALPAARDRRRRDRRVLHPLDPRLGRRPRPAQPLRRHDPGRGRRCSRSTSGSRSTTCAATAPSTSPRGVGRGVEHADGAVVLGIATVATAFVAEMLVGSLEEFGDEVGLSDFFVSIVIVAIVGNAAEHGGAIVVATRGKIKLATEIAVSSAAQVALFVAPAAALLVGDRRHRAAARLPAGRAGRPWRSRPCRHPARGRRTLEALEGRRARSAPTRSASSPTGSPATADQRSHGDGAASDRRLRVARARPSSGSRAARGRRRPELGRVDVRVEPGRVGDDLAEQRPVDRDARRRRCRSRPAG